MTYVVIFTPHADKQLEALPTALQTRIAMKVRLLSRNPPPPGIKAIQGADASTYRLRIGDYRVIYTVHDGMVVVTVVRIAHRREVYR